VIISDNKEQDAFYTSPDYDANEDPDNWPCDEFGESFRPVNHGDEVITETMEQVHKFFEKYLVLHGELSDMDVVMRRAVDERWGRSADVARILKKAESNSLLASASRAMSDPRKNKLIDTSAQGDLFNNVLMKIPSMLMVDGKLTPYYEASITDGFAWWKARHAAKTTEADAYAKAEEEAREQADIAETEAGKVQSLIQKAIESGIDPKTVRYAKQQA